MQKCMFPLPYLRITQDEYSSYSHAGSTATDHGGKDAGSDTALYAPFDGTVVRVRADSSHETYFVSDGPVQCPDGYEGVMTLTFMHDNAPDYPAGTHLKQDEKIGDEGGFGRGKADAFAHHSHIEFSRGRQTQQCKNAKGTWQTPGGVSLYKACYISPQTQVHTGSGYAYRTAAQLSADGKTAVYKGHTFTIAQSEQTENAPPRAGGAVRVTAGALNIRSGPGTQYGKYGQLHAGDTVTPEERADGWGFVKGRGWICLQYTQEVRA